MIWPDGRIYLGDFMGGKQHGYGILTDKDGKQKRVQYENGKRVDNQASTSI